MEKPHEILYHNWKRKMILGIDPGNLRNYKSSNNGICLFDEEKDFIEKACTCVGFSDLEKYVLNTLDNYPFNIIAVEITTSFSGSAKIAAGVHETIGALKYMVRPYGTAVKEVSAIKVANFISPHSTKSERMKWVFENYRIPCDEHTADATIIAIMASKNKIARTFRWLK